MPNIQYNEILVYDTSMTLKKDLLKTVKWYVH